MLGTYSSPDLECNLSQLEVSSISSPFMDLQRDLATFLGIEKGFFILPLGSCPPTAHPAGGLEPEMPQWRDPELHNTLLFSSAPTPRIQRMSWSWSRSRPNGETQSSKTQLLALYIKLIEFETVVLACTSYILGRAQIRPLVRLSLQQTGHEPSSPARREVNHFPSFFVS